MRTPTASRPPSPHVHAKRERRRREILVAALLAFRDRGYHATTLDDIAGRLDVRKTALYHYFPDKESILHACHVESLAELERIVEEARRLPTPAARLRHVITEHVRVMTGSLDGTPLAFEVSAIAPKLRAEIVAGRDRYEGEVRRILEQGMRAGEFRRVDSKVGTFVILGAINWIARWYRPEGALDAAALGAQFADHLVGGLAAPRGARPVPRRAAGRRPRPRKAHA